MAKAYLEGAGWCMRRRYKGHDIYESGHATAAKAEKAVGKKMTDIDDGIKPAGFGPERTTAAQAMQDYALSRLPFKKGAVQEAVRFNQYLRAAGLDTLVVKKSKSAAGGNSGKYFEVSLERHTNERRIAPGLAGHRRAQLTKTAGASQHRAVLATTAMSEITRVQMQAYMDCLRAEGAKPSTMRLEQALWRGLFNHAHSVWRWQAVIDNPATKLKMPAVENERDRVLSHAEQDLLDEAMNECKNTRVKPMVALLRETAMRSSEPLETALWRDVNWDAKLLHLRDAKAGKRDVPLSPLALQALRDIGVGQADEPMVKITYEALKAAFQRACTRAGIGNLKIHDLRHTAATRLALRTGNIFLVKALTGHKTLAMVTRYVNVKASDVVDVMHAPQESTVQMPAQGLKDSTALAPFAAVTAVTPSTALKEPVATEQDVTVSTAAPFKALEAVSAGSVTLTPEQLQEIVSRATATALAALKLPGTGTATNGVHGGAKVISLRKNIA